MSLIQKNNIFDGVDVNNNLQKASKSISDTVSGLRDQLINPFKSVSDTVKSGVAVVSETQSLITKQINDYKSAAVSGIDNLLGALSGGRVTTADLSNVLTYSDGFKVNKDQLLNIASKTIGFNVGNIEYMKNELANNFLSELNEMSGGLSSGLFYNDGEGLKLADDWKMGLGNGLIDFLSKTDDNFSSIINVSAVNSILNTLITGVAQSGMKDGFRSFESQYLFRSDYYSALINNIEILIGRGDLDSLKEVLNIIDKDGINTVKAKYPKFTETILTNYKFPRDVYVENYAATKAILLEIITKVDGNEWYKINTFMGYVVNLGLVSRISIDAKTLLEDEEYIIPFLCASGKYDIRPAIDVFKSDFPNAVDIS